MLWTQPFEELEVRFADFNEVEPGHVIAVSSGTAALHLACEVLVKMRPRYFSILIPEFTMVACPRAAVMAMLRPMFVDVGNDLLLPDVNTESFKRAVMPVHIYGRQCKFDSFLNGDVIEDLAEGHGIKPNPNSFAACWSFYKNKIVRGEEGGAVWFKDRDCAEYARKLRCLGFTANHDYWHIPRGVNARMSNLHAQPIIESLKKVKDNLAIRQDQILLYNGLIPSHWRMPDRTVGWVYDFRIPDLTANLQSQIVKACNQAGVPIRHGFKPMSMQVEFREQPKELNAERLGREVMYLPLGEEFSNDQIRYMTDILLKTCRSLGVSF